jgi:hypothetical protein
LKTVQIRDLDDEVCRALARQVAFVGLSVPEFLRREITRLAGRPSVEERLERTGRGAPNPISRTQMLEVLDEVRGPLLDAGN